MFGRGKKGSSAASAPAAREREPKPGGKGRPTPRRRDAQAGSRRPLVVKDRKAAARAARLKAREQRMQTRHALVTGDEKNMPLRDRGPHRRFARDVVDARWNVGEFFLPIAFAVVVLTLIPNVLALTVGTVLLYGMVLLSVIDLFVLRRGLRRRLDEAFGPGVVPRQVVTYGMLRAFQLRRTRLPKPQVRHGQYPAAPASRAG